MSAAMPATSAAPTSKTALTIGIVLLTLSAVLGVTAVVLGVGAVVHGVRTQTVQSGSDVLQLEEGTWALYELSSGPAVLAPGNDASALGPSDVQVTGPGGKVPVDRVSGTETFTRSGREYLAFAHFDAEKAGAYQVSLESEGREVIVSRSLGDTFRKILPAVLVGIGAVLVGLVGLVVLITALVKRRRAGRPGSPGPGGAPDGTWPPAAGTWQPTGSTWQPTGSTWQPTGSTWQGAPPPRDRGPEG